MRRSPVGLSLLLLLALLACASSDTERASQPRLPAYVRMTKIVFRNVTPGMEPDAPAAQPRTLYRIGERFGRMEYPDDAASGVHLTMIVAEPHIFALDRNQQTARYTRDPGPSYVFHAPILKVTGVPKTLIELEYGKELEFLERHDPSFQEIIGPDGKTVDRFEAAIAYFRVVLLVDPYAGSPTQLEIYAGDELLRAIHYDEYAIDLDPELSLFQPPEGVQIVGLPQEPATPAPAETPAGTPQTAATPIQVGSEPPPPASPAEPESPSSPSAASGSAPSAPPQ